MNKKYKILWGGKDDTSIPSMFFDCFTAGTKVLMSDGTDKKYRRYRCRGYCKILE